MKQFKCPHCLGPAEKMPGFDLIECHGDIDCHFCGDESEFEVVEGMEKVENGDWCKRVLYLTLSQKWFDLIAAGEKTVEYREAKPYWRKRFLDQAGFAIEFDEIHFRNGYAKYAPFMRVEWRDLGHSDNGWTGKHGEKFEGPVFAIGLGKVLEVVKTKEGYLENRN